MDVFGGGWSNYTEKIRDGFSALEPEDVCVICGDLSWAMSLEESTADFKFIGELPGKKIILKGNHEYWWSTVSRMKKFFQSIDVVNIDILNNNCFFYEGAAICGTRGWFVDEADNAEHSEKIMARETSRLRASLAAAGNADPKLCFFHYPPRYKDIVCDEIIAAMNDYGVKNCWYGHIHGHGHRSAVTGVAAGIDYKMVSADYIDFIPQRVDPF